MNVLIVEDEIMAQKSLARVLAQHFPDMEIVGYTTSVKGTVAWLNNPENRADIIFMDVELADGECFEIFRQTEVKAKVIMTTAYDSYALKAFEAGSVDYLLKPVDASALKRAVARCRMSGGHVDADIIMKAIGGGRPEKGIQGKIHRTVQRPHRAASHFQHRIHIFGREEQLSRDIRRAAIRHRFVPRCGERRTRPFQVLPHLAKLHNLASVHHKHRKAGRRTSAHNA